MTPLLLLAALIATPAEKPRIDSFNADFYLFSQTDDGANPFRDEAMNYYALRLGMRVQANREVGVSGTAAVSEIINPDIVHKGLPGPLAADIVTSASAALLTLDALLAIDYRPLSSSWTFTPAVYYHHQKQYYGPGVDLGFSGDLGDTQLAFTYSFRGLSKKNLRYDGIVLPSDWQFANNLYAGITQTLSPSWLVGMSLQYTRQDGDLGDSFGYVVVVDAVGQPVALTPETLPNYQNRLQVNLRTRYSPIVGTSLGADASYYNGDWGIDHGALEVNAEHDFFDAVRVRLWYRIALQTASKYFAPSPQTAVGFVTQDSDLAAFVLHAPGIQFLIPVAREPTWTIKLSLFGFYRDDGLWTAAMSTGVNAQW